MKNKKCKICNGFLYDEPLLILENMPSRAQFFPTENILKKDRGITLKIFQCAFCGVVQLTNKPVSYYKNVIRATSISKEMILFRRKQFKEFVKKFFLKGKKIVEIGCGSGEFLSIMKELDVKPYGIEYNKELVEKCLRNKLIVTREFIEDENYKLINGPFDGFYILNFLEHLPYPKKVLYGIYNNLTQKGVGIVEVPNFNMIIQKKLLSEFIIDHLFYFTKETFTTTLNLCGFEVIECKEIWHNYIISAIVKKREKLDLSPFKKHWGKIKIGVEKFIDKLKNKKICIWGAGHQALTIISLLNLSSKIKYIIDSAPFKQNKYTPATHLPIVPPEFFYSNPVDGIIIMAGSYSDEVSKIIRKKFNKNIKVAILRDYGLEEIS